MESLAVGLKFEELGVYSYSFSYAMQGSVGGAPLKDIKGYVFSSTGEIMEFPNGDKKSIHESAIEEFKKSKESAFGITGPGMEEKKKGTAYML